MLRYTVFSGTNVHRQMRVGLVIRVWLLLIGLAGLAGCTAQATPPAPAPPTIVRVYPKQQQGYIPNPYMGWQDTLDDPAKKRFTETIGYIRNNWYTFNPAQGVYDWSQIEHLRERMHAEHHMMSFRIQNAKPLPWGTGHGVPDWVMATGAVTVEGSICSEPLYANCSFLEHHGVFIDALRQQYDGDPDVAFIDVGSYGVYGEWHSDQYDWSGEETLDWHARRRIVDMYLGGTGTRPCTDASGNTIMATYSYTGFHKTQLIMPYTPGYSDSVFYAFSKRQDLGIRHDALGSEKHQNRYREELRELVAQVWPHDPIIFEFYPEAYTPESLRSARDFAEEMHASIIHENFDGQGDNALIERILERVGYRLILREATYTSNIQPGSSVDLHLFWENGGVAPPYVTSYPLLIAIDDAQGKRVASQRVAINLHEWLPNTPIPIDTTIAIPQTLAPGDYHLSLAFVTDDNDDNDAGKQSVLALAVEGCDERGYFPIGTLTVLEP